MEEVFGRNGGTVSGSTTEEFFEFFGSHGFADFFGDLLEVVDVDGALPSETADYIFVAIEELEDPLDPLVAVPVAQLPG